MPARHLWLLCVFLLCSCGNGLSRGKAEDLISKQLSLPATHTTKLFGYYSKRFWSDPVVGFGTITICRDDGIQFADNEQQLNEWQSKGLITIGESSGKSGACHSLGATTTLTDEGKKYLVTRTGGVSEVRTNDVAFGEVTGIQVNEQFKVAEVDYTLKNVNLTPFGSGTSTAPIVQKAMFRLFDDGWRLAQ
jgi:hypothetical protein